MQGRGRLCFVGTKKDLDREDSFRAEDWWRTQGVAYSWERREISNLPYPRSDFAGHRADSN